MSSCTPSAKKAFSGPGLRFSKGSTAMDLSNSTLRLCSGLASSGGVGPEARPFDELRPGDEGSDASGLERKKKIKAKAPKITVGTAAAKPIVIQLRLRSCFLDTGEPPCSSRACLVVLIPSGESSNAQAMMREIGKQITRIKVTNLPAQTGISNWGNTMDDTCMITHATTA